jgi:hypothetical protein
MRIRDLIRQLKKIEADSGNVQLTVAIISGNRKRTIALESGTAFSNVRDVQWLKRPAKELRFHGRIQYEEPDPNPKPKKALAPNDESGGDEWMEPPEPPEPREK